MRLLYLLALTFVAPTKSISVKTTLEITQNLLEIAGPLIELLGIVNDHADLIDLPGDKQEEKIFATIDNINLQIKALDERLYGVEQNINTIIKMLNNLPNVIRNELKLHDIQTKQSYLDIYYSNMERYVRDFDEYENSTLVHFGDNVVSDHPNSVPFLMEAIYRQITREDFLKEFQKQFGVKGSLFCKENQSPQQTFHTFLNEMLMTNFKSYLLELTAYHIKKLHRKGKFKEEVKASYNNFVKRANDIITKMRKYMAMSSTELWRCDPEDAHVQNKTYVEITNFLHGIIMNKANLDPNGNCEDECDVFTMTKRINCGDNKWCRQQPSCSKIINCRYVDAGMNVCSSNMVKRKRRYEYIKFENGGVFGKENFCKSAISSLKTYNYWIIRRCSYCFCVCDEGPKYFSDRYINLRLSMANIHDNRVVTGLRFVKRNKIIHLQVQEGKLLPKGEIDADTVQWVPTENYKTTDRHIYEGQDYHTLTWEERSIELSNIIAKEGSIVTGVRFRRIGTRLDLEVMTTPFNFTTGKLHRHPSKWSEFFGTRNLEIRHKFGQEVKLYKPDIPTRSLTPSTQITTDKYVRFTHTDLEKDAGQTTVPFFDAQPVTSKVPVPLSGVGLHHKGWKGSGGFIAPKVFTYDFSKHLKTIPLRNKWSTK